MATYIKTIITKDKLEIASRVNGEEFYSFYDWNYKEITMQHNGKTSCIGGRINGDWIDVDPNLPDPEWQQKATQEFTFLSAGEAYYAIVNSNENREVIIRDETPFTIEYELYEMMTKNGQQYIINKRSPNAQELTDILAGKYGDNKQSKLAKLNKVVSMSNPTPNIKPLETTPINTGKQIADKQKSKLQKLISISKK